jgi:hypothetical protein
VNPTPDVAGIREVLDGLLDGLSYPAYRWQVIAQAQHWGADPGSVEELCELGPDRFDSLDEVATALAEQRGRRGRR